MLRGINRQVVFNCDADKYHFMKVLQECKEVSGFKLHAFCLMSNHIHLLIEPADEPLEIIFKRIGSRYAVWYNRKYQRAGHLFQDRFRSENVETDQYYMTVLRYILQNPMKAGMESKPGNYRWSSYLAYEKGAGSITDTQYATALFGGRDQLLDYIRQINDDVALDESPYDWRIKEEQAKEIMTRISSCASASEFQKLAPALRRKCLEEMYLERLTMGQIARLTGVSKITLQTGEKMRQVLDSDYALFARARGESTWVFIRRHGLRNVMLPFLTLQLGSISELFGGSVLAETVFTYPGLGNATVQSALRGDIPLFIGIALFSSVFVFGGNLLANILYAVVDPRIREGEKE